MGISLAFLNIALAVLFFFLVILEVVIPVFKESPRIFAIEFHLLVMFGGSIVAGIVIIRNIYFLLN